MREHALGLKAIRFKNLAFSKKNILHILWRTYKGNKNSLHWILCNWCIIWYNHFSASRIWLLKLKKNETGFNTFEIIPIHVGIITGLKATNIVFYFQDVGNVSNNFYSDILGPRGIRKSLQELIFSKFSMLSEYSPFVRIVLKTEYFLKYKCY